MYDYDDWEDSDKNFNCFNKIWVGYIYGLYADSKNTKFEKILKIFDSWDIGIDVFALGE